MTGRSGKVDRILVGFGGSDPGNETGKALSAIKSLRSPSLAVDVVIGLTNPNVDSMTRLCREMPRAQLHCGADNMAELMGNADIAIGAGGVMSWERCCLALPTIAVGIADNQTGALTALAGSGAVTYLGLGTICHRGSACGSHPGDAGRPGADPRDGRSCMRACRRAGHFPGPGGDEIAGERLEPAGLPMSVTKAALSARSGGQSANIGRFQPQPQMFLIGVWPYFLC